MELVVKIACKKGVIYFCIVLLITKCMYAEIKGDEKLLIDLEWPNFELCIKYPGLTYTESFACLESGRTFLVFAFIAN